MMLKNILDLCQERGITVAELERKAGLKPRTIYKWDKNKPSFDKAVAVADALGVKVDELVRQKGGE